MHVAGRQDQLVCPQKSDDLIDIYRRSGRPEDFEQIVRRFAALVLSETRRVTRNPHDAEDASQLTFLALAMEIKSGTNILRVGPWLQRVSRRQALKIVRSRGRRQRREDAVRRSEMQLVDVDKPLDQAVAAGIIRDAIDQLPDRYRLPVVLHYFGGMSLEMIAAEMKITRQTVGTRLHRGRKMLAARLGKQGVVLDSITLAGAMGVLVPAAVIRAVMQSAGGLHASAGALAGAAGQMAAQVAALPGAVTQMLRVASLGAIQKPMRVAIVAVALACSGSGMALVLHPNWAAQLRPAQAIEWLQRVLKFHPHWSFSLNDEPAAPTVVPSIASSNDVAETTTIPEIPFTPTWAHLPPGQWLAPVENSGDVVAAKQVAPAPIDPKVASARSTSAHVESTATARANPALSSTENPNHTAAPNAIPGATEPAKGHDVNEPDGKELAASPFLSPASSTPLVLGSQGGDGGDHVELAGGMHRFSNVDVGVNQSAALAITGGADLVTPLMRLGVSSGGSGTVIQQGGHVSVGPLIVGDAGAGSYNLSGGGQLDVGQLTIGAQSQSHGQVRIASGEVVVTQPDGNVTIGDAGNGALILGSQYSSGALHSASDASVPVVVRNQASAKGLILGWGAVGTGGELINNGRIVADGFNQVRTLDLTHFSKIDNTIDNPPDGDNGWFVQRGGRIALPAIQVQPAVQTYTWGESSADPTLDLVNSVRLNVYGQQTPATVSLTLRTATAADPLSVAPPQNVALVGLWQVNTDQFDPTLVNYIVRYDATVANVFATGESAVGLYAYNGQWEVADATSSDSAVHLVSGDFNGSISYLAVGVAYHSVYVSINPASGLNQGTTFDGTLVNTTFIPEPSCGMLLLVTLGIMSKRRNRDLGRELRH